MVPFYGDFDTTETVYIPFNTFDSNDPSASVTATTLLASDVHVHKDGAVAQRTSTSGFTLSLNFDSVTGNHLLALDLSDNTDAGFWANGSQYQVRIEGATVDAGNINAFIGAFSIGRTLRPTTAGRKLDVTATGAAGIDWGNVENPTTAVDLSGTDIQLCDTVTTLTGHTAQTGDSFARLAAPAGASVSADIAAIKAETALIVADTNELQTDDVPGLIAALNDPTAAAVAAAVWDEDATGHQTTGTFGQAIGDPVANTKTLYAALVTDATGASVTADVATAQADLDTITGADGVNLLSATQASIDAIETDTNSLNDTKIPDTISLAAINAQVDTALSDIDLDHWTSNGTAVPAVTAGSYFDQLTDDGTAAYDRTTDSLQAIRDHATTIKSETALIVADTNELQTDWADAGRLDAILDARASQTTADAIETDTQDLQTQIGTAGAGLTDLGGMSTAMKAEINVEAKDVLFTDTDAEPGQGAPAATTTLAAKIGYLYKNWRNRKTQDATTWELYADDATTVDQKATVSDDGTDAEKGEIATGP